MEQYCVEPANDGMWQSVFPSDLAEFSQLHTTASEAVSYIEAMAGDVPVIVQA
jgi:hypothetical protein